ncbi:Zinc finger (C3HC4-type RING finger) family protein [Rhynchospora pubera]|uniref:Zinc finger (C3HC4-type RING finger) family protein n=1 Tax=Rhynchospora pubera TaxID=906938 RepID=A0AAV8E4K9_9POAL|nr:Zinc finger (C3HC4-type RING finger) family protein [Rhynchospora pubera]
MENAWSRAKRALTHRLCISLTRTRDDVAGATSGQAPASEAVSLTPSAASGSRSSKKICAICLGGMKSGHGQALFTAECSHTFHFQCISSNVKHGNYVCPVCRAKWKEIPSVITAPAENIHGRARVNPINLPHEDNSINLFPRFSRFDAFSGHLSSFHVSEPSTFDDDEVVLSPSESHKDIRSEVSQTVEIKTYPEYSAVPQLSSKDDFAVLIHLKAPDGSCIGAQDIAGTATRAPIDLVTVLDVSGSMSGSKLTLLKRAMGFVIHSLGPSDRLSVVAFASSARRLFPLSRMSGPGKQRALQAVNSLTTGGGTNIADGLKKAAKVIDERKQKNAVCSIVLLSDGQDTHTISANRIHADYKALIPSTILRSAATGGIQTPVHTFGFGTDHDSVAMHSISENSHGTFSFIENEEVIQDAFAQCIGGLLSVVVQSMRLRVECLHPDVVLTSIHSGSYSSELHNNGQSGVVEVGDLYSDEERDFLLSLKVPSVFGELETQLIEVSYTYNDPVSKDVIKLEGEDVTVQRSENSDITPLMSIEVDRERNRVRAAEAMSVARMAAERGEFAQAVSVLEERRKLLSESLAARGGDQLCIALDAELREMQERMANRRRYEESGRAYMLSGLSSHWSQRATARGDSTESHSMVHSYQTPSMVDMLQRSQTFLPPDRGSPTPRPQVRQSRSFGGRFRLL